MTESNSFTDMGRVLRDLKNNTPFNQTQFLMSYHVKLLFEEDTFSIPFMMSFFVTNFL